MNFIAHQEKKKNENTGKRAAVEEEKNSLPSLETLNAAFWEGQPTFSPNPNWFGDRTTTLKRLLIGADK